MLLFKIITTDLLFAILTKRSLKNFLELKRAKGNLVIVRISSIFSFTRHHTLTRATDSLYTENNGKQRGQLPRSLPPVTIFLVSEKHTAAPHTLSCA